MLLGIVRRDAATVRGSASIQEVDTILDHLAMTLLVQVERHPLWQLAKTELRATASAHAVDHRPELLAYWTTLGDRIAAREDAFHVLSRWDGIPDDRRPELLAFDGTPASRAAMFIREFSLTGAWIGAASLDERLDLLTERERAAVMQLVYGDSSDNQAIADGLGIGVRTAEGHIRRAMVKLHCASRTELALKVLRLA